MSGSAHCPPPRQQQKRLPTPSAFLSAPNALIFNPHQIEISPTQILAARLHQTMWRELEYFLGSILTINLNFTCFGVNQPAQAYAIVAVLCILTCVFSGYHFLTSTQLRSLEPGGNLSGSGIGLRASNLSCHPCSIRAIGTVGA